MNRAFVVVALVVQVSIAYAQDHDRLTVHDHPAVALPHNIPDFCESTTIQSVASGAWSNPSIWSLGRVPAAGDRVGIAAGTSVSYDVVNDSALNCLGVNGAMTFAVDRNTRINVGTLMVMSAGTLTIGTVAAPLPAAYTAEIVIANQALNTTADPEQAGTGLLGFGRVTMHGAEKSPAWVRLAEEPLAGQTTLMLSAAVSGWRVGDRVILPDTRHLKWNEVTNWTRNVGQWEERTVAAVAGNGLSITLNAPLTYDHRGARDGSNVLRLLPHVGNLTRNVIVRSEVPIGSPGVQGHTLFTDRATVDIRYAAFRDLGRTLASTTGPGNPIGRYPIHFHHLMGPATTPSNGYQYTFVGNAIDGGSTDHRRRWGVAIHNTHYGLVADNVLYNYGGALLAAEDGSESYNVIERNFGMRSAGTGGRLGDGNEGQGFWFRGPNNYVRGNVAANLDSDGPEASYGFKYQLIYLGDIRIPTAKGQSPSQYVTVYGNNLPVLEFNNNEVYGAAQGLTYWWVSSQDPVASTNPRESIFRNLRIWHVYNIGIYHYPSARIRFDGLQIFGTDPASSACCTVGFFGGDYAASDVRIVNSEIHGMGTGVAPSTAGTGVQVVENSILDNSRDVSIGTMYSVNGGGWLPARRTILINTQFRGTRAIDMGWHVRSDSNTAQLDEVLVYGYQGNPADNFQVFYNEQATQDIAGGLAPCTTRRSEIDGIVCTSAAATAPVIAWVSPFSGSTAGGTSVALEGANFATGASVRFGSTAAASVLVNGGNRITAIAPP